VNTLPVEKICADAATDNCPCVATITKDCPVCNLLDHGQKCDCNQTWPGLCIYERYLQEGLTQIPVFNDRITVIQKFNLDQYVKIICRISPDKISSFRPLQGINILTNSYKHAIKLFGVVTKVVKEKNLITLAVKDTDYESPIKFGPILQKSTELELKGLGQILPPLMINNMEKILISVDNFWLSIINPLIDTLKNAEKEVVIIGPFSLKTAGQISLTLADKVIPIDKFTTLAEEIRNSDYDTIINLNTPLWQRKIIALLWNEKINKSLITVNNQWI